MDKTFFIMMFIWTLNFLRKIVGEYSPQMHRHQAGLPNILKHILEQGCQVYFKRIVVKQG